MYAERDGSTGAANRKAAEIKVWRIAKTAAKGLPSHEVYKICIFMYEYPRLGLLSSS